LQHTSKTASGEWQWGDRKVGGGSTVAVEQAAAMRAWRLGSRMDGETTAIREEGASGDFLFLFPCGWQCCLLGRSSVEAHQRVSGQNGLPSHSIIVYKYI